MGEHLSRFEENESKQAFQLLLYTSDSSIVIHSPHPSVDHRAIADGPREAGWSRGPGSLFLAVSTGIQAFHCS